MGSVVAFPSVTAEDLAVGRRLKYWREQRRLSPDALAGALSVAPEAVARFEAGRLHLSSDQLAAATACLHLPLWALVSDKPAY